MEKSKMQRESSKRNMTIIAYNDLSSKLVPVSLDFLKREPNTVQRDIGSEAFQTLRFTSYGNSRFMVFLRTYSHRD